MSWVDEVKQSIPPYASDVKSNLEIAMEHSSLTELDAHACALAASCAISNGGLANEISMNGPLFGKDERENAKTAAVTAAMLDSYYSFSEVVVDSTAPAVTVYERYAGEERVKFVMYSLAAAITLRSTYTTMYVDQLRLNGVSDQQIKDIAKIAAVISAINKIVA